MADGVHHTAFILSLAQHRVNGLAHIGQRDIFNQFNFAGVAIDLNFRSTPRDLPKSRGRALGRLFTFDVLVGPASNDFTALR